MSTFDDRWRRLAAASRRAPAPPLAGLPELIAMPRRARPGAPTLAERFALRVAVAVGAVAYAIAAWLLPLAIDASGSDHGVPGAIAVLSRPSLAALTALPRPPTLPPPRRVFAALGDAIASLSGGFQITGAAAASASPAAAPSTVNAPGTPP